MLQQKKGNNEIIQIILDMTIKKKYFNFLFIVLILRGSCKHFDLADFFFIDDLPDASLKGSVLLY